MSKILAYITENIITTAAALPVASNLRAEYMVQGLCFRWSDAVIIAPHIWEARTKVGGGAWSAWAQTLTPTVNRILTPAEYVADQTPVIYIEVRSTDGLGNYGVVSAYNAEVVEIAINSIADDAVGVDALTSAVTDRMFTTSEKDGAELKAGSVTGSIIAAATVAIANLATAVIDRIFASSTEKTNTVTYAGHGETAYNKIVAEVGANTTETTAGSQAKVDARLTASEKTKLETAMGVDLADLSGDTFLIIGTDDTVTGNAVGIKTALALEHVENKSSATIRGEIVEGDLPATAVLTTNVLAKINASAEATKIANTALQDILATKVVNAAAADVFDTNGNLLMGVNDGTATVTAANVLDVVGSDGLAKNLDLTSIGAGTLNNIPQTGTNKSVTANEKTGAGYAYLGLDSSGRQAVGITATAGNFTSQQIALGITPYREFADQPELTLTGASYGSLSITGTGADIGIMLKKFIKNQGQVKANFRLQADNYGDGASKVRILVYDEANAVLLVTGSYTDPITAGGFITASVDISSLTPGTIYTMRLCHFGTLSGTYTLTKPIYGYFTTA